MLGIDQRGRCQRGHRTTKPRCPWTNGQVERITRRQREAANRTIKDATVKRYHDGSREALRHHLQFFVDAYNYGCRLKPLRGLTPYEFICKTWTEQPVRFKLYPSQYTLGPNI